MTNQKRIVIIITVIITVKESKGGIFIERHSTRRDVVLNLLRSTTSHPTAAWIYENARKQIPNISLGTVYRNLSDLQKNGDIIAITTGDGTVHYDARLTDHAHFYCANCHSVIDVFISKADEINAFAENQLDCTVSGQQLVLFGCCKNCKK